MCVENEIHFHGKHRMIAAELMCETNSWCNVELPCFATINYYDIFSQSTRIREVFWQTNGGLKIYQADQRNLRVSYAVATWLPVAVSGEPDWSVGGNQGAWREDKQTWQEHAKTKSKKHRETAKVPGIWTRNLWLWCQLVYRRMTSDLYSDENRVEEEGTVWIFGTWLTCDAVKSFDLFSSWCTQ